MSSAGTEREDRVRRGLADRPYLLLSLTSLFWAANTVLGRFVVGHIPPVSLAFIRWMGAFLILLPFAVPYLVRDWPTIRKHVWLLTVLSVTGFSVYNALAYYALQYMTAIDGLLLLSISPLFVAMWSFALFGDRLTLRQFAGICVSIVGVLVIISRGSFATFANIGLNRGDLIMIAALAIYAYYTATLRTRPRMHQLSFLAVGMGWGAVFLIPFVAWEILSGQPFVFDATTVASSIFVCIFPSILAYLCFNRGVELIGANRAAPFLYLIPVFGSAMAIAFLGERFEVYHAVSYVLIFAGIAVATRK
jgi:drug/metabolite transporter (DMT)-like permease